MYETRIAQQAHAKFMTFPPEAYRRIFEDRDPAARREMATPKPAPDAGLIYSEYCPERSDAFGPFTH